MKKIIYTLLLISSLTLVAQNDINYDGIFMGSYIPEQMESIPSSAKKMLANKLTQIITSKGISDNSYSSRFIITPNIAVLTKNVTPTAPPKVVLNLEVTFYIGDGIEGTMFTNETVEVKGVGTNENKAYIAAIRQIKPKSPIVQAFVKKGKKRIIEYYNNNCNLVIKKVDALNGQNKYEEALAILAGVPEASSCYNKIKTKILSTYNKSMEYDCKVKLAEAQGILAANQDIDSINEATALLASVEPNAPCFSKVKSVFSKIAARVKELNDRGWNYKLKVLNVEKSRIKAARDVGVAYGNNQKQNTYNIRGWY